MSRSERQGDGMIVKASTRGWAVPVVALVACTKLSSEQTSLRTKATAPTIATAEPSVSAERAIQLPLRHVVSETGGLRPNESSRFIVALHGLGDTPENFQGLAQGAPFKARWYFPAAPRQRDWYDGARGADGENLEQNIRLAAKVTADYLQHLAQDPKNEGKPIVTGFSQGGMLSYALAALYPEQIAAALPIAGMLPDRLWEQIRSHHAGHAPPIFAFHGNTDSVIPFAPTAAQLDSLRSAGYRVRLSAFDGVAHRIPEPMHRAWLLAVEQEVSRN